MADGRVQEFRRTYREARARGDVNLANAMQVELRRLGAGPEPARMETTVAEMPERAVPAPPRRGRPPRPRCEHGEIADKCLACSPDLEHGVPAA